MKENNLINLNPNFEDLIDKKTAKKLAPYIVENTIRTFSISALQYIVLKAALGSEDSPDYRSFKYHFPDEKTMITFDFKLSGQHFLGQFGFNNKEKLVSTRIVEPFNEATSIKEGKKILLRRDLRVNPSLLGFKVTDRRVRKYVH